LTGTAAIARASRYVPTDSIYRQNTPGDRKSKRSAARCDDGARVAQPRRATLARRWGAPTTAPVRTERDKMLAGELYDPRDAELVTARARARDLCQALNATREADHDARRRLVRALFASGGESACVQPPFFCDYGANIQLGERVFFNFNCVVLDVCPVRIGDDTLFGPAVQIYTATHPLEPSLRRRLELGKPVEIGSEVWVGGGAIILPGVLIGARSVVGAGSVVTRDIPPRVFAAGNPCRVIRALSDEELAR